MVAHSSTAGCSILDNDTDDTLLSGIDKIWQIDQIIDSFEEQLHRLRAQRSEVPGGSAQATMANTTLDVNSGVNALLELEKTCGIDERINLHEERLRRLRTRRNTKIPISRLPNELMAHIFACCVYDAAGFEEWYTFTHVCHSWRLIALNYAPLWTSINDTSSIDIVRTMLERSKSAILDIAFRSLSVGPKWEELSRVIQEELPRIGHLTAGMDSGDRRHIRNFVYDLVQSAPSLRSLRLIYSNNRTRMKLPDQFLSGMAPLLTQIHLYSVEIPWNSPLLQNLTSLTLGNGSCGTGKQMFDTLRRLPQLEVLDLDGIFPRDITETDLIPLPKLRHLSLSASSEELDACTGFIKHLLFPCTTILHIHYTAKEDVNAFNPILSHLSQIFSETRIEPSSSRTIRALSLEFDYRGLWEFSAIDFEAWNISSIPPRINGAIGPRLPVSPPILYLRLGRDRHGSRHIPDDLKAIFGSFQMNFIETLHIRGCGNSHRDRNDGDRITSLDKVCEYLGSRLWSTSLKVLRVSGSYYAGQLPILLGARNGSDSGLSAESPIVAFPALLDAYVRYSNPRTSRPGSLLASLVGALESRMKHGCKLRKLTIKNGRYDGLTEEQVVSLKEVVEELDWDFEEQLKAQGRASRQSR